jgi:hypothetical protein
MIKRLRWRWLKAKAWRLARRHYMFIFTLIALAVAGAGALGYFERDADDSPTQAIAPTPTATRSPLLTPLPFIPTDPLTVTYYLVDNEHDVNVLESVEDRMIFREILEADAIEILLIRNEEEEAEANRKLEEAKDLAEDSGFILVVQDLRE